LVLDRAPLDFVVIVIIIIIVVIIVIIFDVRGVFIKCIFAIARARGSWHRDRWRRQHALVVVVVVIVIIIAFFTWRCVTSY
jgi:sterol desaturase/sphingolipid hydroxylase (fatty acid hydroxylase superfamily)